MNKDDLLQRLGELNSSLKISRNESDEYNQILQELRKAGVPSMSQSLIKDEDCQKKLSDFSDSFISPKIKVLLMRSGISTVGELLDLDRLEAMKLPGLGDKKWLIIYSIQKSLYDLYSHKDLLICEVVDPLEEKVKEIIPFTHEELQNINQEMLACEIAAVKNLRYDKNKYQKYVNELYVREQKRSDAFKDDEFYEIPVKMLLNLPACLRVSSMIKRSNVERVVEILDFTENDVLNQPNQGRTSWRNIVKLKRDILDNTQNYLREYKEKYMIHVLPENAEGQPLYERCITALQQLADIAEKRGEERYSYLIKEFFINGKSLEEIAQNIPQVQKITNERVRQLIVEYRLQIMSGSENPLVDNAYFSDELIDKLNELPQELLYHSLSYANQCMQAPEDSDCMPIIRLLNLDILDVTKYRDSFMDAPRVIPSEKSGRCKSYVASHIKAIHYEMNELARPEDKDEIVSKVMASDYLPENFDLNVIERILADHAWIEEIEDGKYWYPYEKLNRAETKAARIIYEKKNITTGDIQRIDRERTSAVNKLKFRRASLLLDNPWVQQGARNDQFIYAPQPIPTLEPLQITIEKYAKEKIRFHFSDMVASLKKQGYQYSESVFRTYVMRYCVPSNADRNLICLESEIDESDRNKWRQRTVRGTTNWIINSCINLLGSEKLKIKKLQELVFSQLEAENYNAKDITQYVAKYCCKYEDYLNEKEKDKSFISNMPFFIKNDEIWVNQQCLEEGLVDLDKIGFANKQSDYYMTVMTEIVNQLKQSTEQKMRLVKLRDICTPLINHPSKYSIFYKIVEKLPEEVEKVTEEDGSMYLYYKTEKQTYEKTYSLPVEDNVDSNEDSQDEIPQVVETTRTENNYIRGRIVWEDMACELKRELGHSKYNKYWWNLEDVTMDEGIDRFVSFLETANNDRVIHEDLSCHIFELFTQRVTKYDTYDHLRTITLSFEPIIRRIYMLNNPGSIDPQTNGLADCIKLVPELETWASIHWSQIPQNDFRIIYNKIYRTRNKFAHGSDVEMNHPEMFQAAYSFVTLFIYVISRFTKEVA